MKRNLPITHREVDFPETSNILSTTDLKGCITYVNEDFIHISGFTEEELLRKNHNVVRHPEMPPAAFEDLWCALKAGRPWMGMVKNRCKNGDHYWVSAYVTPVMRQGQVVEYQSVRTRPPRRQVEAAQRVYAALAAGRIPAALRLPWPGIRWRILGAIAAGTVAGTVMASLFTGVSPAALLLIGSVSLLVAGGLAWTALTPLCRVAAQARRVARNPVGQYIYTGRTDEAGEIAFAMRMLEAEAGAVVGRIGDAAQRLSGNSDHLVSAVENSNRASQGQKQETDQVAAATNQMAASVQEVARSAQRTADAADKADAEVRAGHRVVGEAGAAIERLAAEIERASAVMRELENQSAEISSVTDVIRGIAEQTNLLALNAAIEAARAGEQGRGFAVVADEVRTLANRTHHSTEEILVMIEKLQKGTQNAVQAMERSREQAEHSVARAKNAAQELDSITRSVAEIRDMSNQIAAAVEEQSAVGEEINRSVVSIREAADVTATHGHDSARVAQAVASLAAGLQDLVGQFWEKRR